MQLTYSSNSPGASSPLLPPPPPTEARGGRLTSRPHTAPPSATHARGKRCGLTVRQQQLTRLHFPLFLCWRAMHSFSTDSVWRLASGCEAKLSSVLKAGTSPSPAGPGKQHQLQLGLRWRHSHKGQGDLAREGWRERSTGGSLVAVQQQPVLGSSSTTTRTVQLGSGSRDPPAASSYCERQHPVSSSNRS